MRSDDTRCHGMTKNFGTHLERMDRRVLISIAEPLPDTLEMLVNYMRRPLSVSTMSKVLPAPTRDSTVIENLEILAG